MRKAPQGPGFSQDAKGDAPCLALEMFGRRTPAAFRSAGAILSCKEMDDAGFSSRFRETNEVYLSSFSSEIRSQMPDNCRTGRRRQIFLLKETPPTGDAAGFWDEGCQVSRNHT
jgi:hypothetical protein